jgi:hypothetical protein
VSVPQKGISERNALYSATIDLKAAIFTLDRADQTAAVKECRKVLFGALRATQLTLQAIEKRK